MATLSVRPQPLVVRWSLLYTLSKQSISLYAPLSAGVYEIWLGYQDGSKRRIYVGQAVNIDNRLSDHLNENDNDCLRELVSKYACYFRFAKLATQWERDGAERALYLRYRHHCNSASGIPSSPNVVLSEL
jgi:hypothetical protein